MLLSFIQNTPETFKENFFDNLISLDSPILQSLFLITVLLIIILFIYRAIFIPLTEKHKEEKEKLEKENLKLMALFSELDPDPVLRVDKSGKIIFYNSFAEEIFNGRSPKNTNIEEIIPNIDLDVKKLIEKEEKQNLTIKLNNKHFSVTCCGIPSLNFAHIYLHNITDRVIAEDKLRDYQIKLKELSMHLEDKLEDERNLIARELHDSIGQNLSLLRMKVQNTSGASSIDEINNLFINISEELNDAIQEVKAVSYRLKPKILDELGLEPAIRSLVAQVNNDSSINGMYSILGKKRRIKSSLETCLYRVTQEAISNILSHSRAHEFEIQLIYLPALTRMIISDDGEGFDQEELTNLVGSGLGLVNMRERVTNLNGEFKLESTPGHGTMIVAEVPNR